MPTRRTVLIVSAGMGAGHDAVAVELAGRLAAEGVEAEIVDILKLLPFRLGAVLRGWYGWMMCSAPWLYALIYRVFFVSDLAPPTSPLTVLAAARLRGLIRHRMPDEVVSTFHLAAQAAGHLRRHGRLPVPSTVLLTDFAAHRLWLHPGTDRYLCSDQATARAVHAATGRPAFCHAPLVRPEFLRPAADTASVRSRIGARAGDRLVLVSAGAWGVGGVEGTARVLARSGRYLPVVLCGRNRELRHLLRHAGIALGWCDDMPDLMAAAYALVDNAAGLTCREAMAAGVPVISYRPIPGHGRDGARAMARAGLSVYVDDAGELLAALDRLGSVAERERRIAGGAVLFNAPLAESFLVPAGSRALPDER